jgi:hypothetical protein
VADVRRVLAAFEAGATIVLNLLSVGAAYGLIVAVFQYWWGNGLLGFQQVDIIEAWVPLFLAGPGGRKPRIAA